MTFLLAFWNIAKITIPIPLALLTGVFLWWQIDKGSAIRKAVAGYVAQVELESERAKLQSTNLILDEIQKQNKTLIEANENFEKAIINARVAQDEIEKQLAIIEKNPVNKRCVVDTYIYKRLLNK